jgi:ADP-ribosylglycohydrolase
MPYNSWGNGSAMRVSPVGWYCDSIDDVLAEAQRSAEVTHNHPEGIKGAQAAAAAVYLARTGKSKAGITVPPVAAFGFFR